MAIHGRSLLAACLMGALGAFIDPGARAAANAVVAAKPGRVRGSHYSSGRTSGAAAAKRQSRKQRNIAKHPRGAV